MGSRMAAGAQEEASQAPLASSASSAAAAAAAAAAPAAASGPPPATSSPRAGETAASSAPAPAPGAGAGAGAGAADEGRLVSAGEELIRKLKDPETDPGDLIQNARDAVARKEFAGMLRARDERGRTPLHVATSRGDLRMCQEMIKADPGIVNEADAQRNTPIMEAALHGRCLIVKELLKHAAEVTRKNKDCMNALQLACVNEGAGNGDVVESLVEAAADPSNMCWQTTPMMAAADSGHIWSVQILIELGADPWQMNGSGMTALDYARDMETAQLLYDVMQGDRLSNKPAPRFNTQRLFKDAEARRARLHRAAREVALEDAFAALEIPVDWLPGFRESGEHFNEIRKAWRRVCLRCHPDKQPEGLEDEVAAEWVAKFQTACAAFEAVERHFRHVCTDEALLPDRAEQEEQDDEEQGAERHATSER